MQSVYVGSRWELQQHAAISSLLDVDHIWLDLDMEGLHVLMQLLTLSTNNVLPKSSQAHAVIVSTSMGFQ